MNKYALILPLVILSFFLGYFASGSKMEHVYTIATVTTVLVAIAGCLLFFKHQKVGDSKQTRKTKVTTAFIAVLLFSTLIGVQFVNLAEANFLPPQPSLPSICIIKDGRVYPSAPIQRVGEVYTFTGNIANYTLDVQRDNIVVDGTGYTLQGNGSGTGIRLKNRTGVTIKNLELKQFATGINMFSSSNITITGNNLTSTGNGITLHSCSTNSIEGNKISGSSLAILLYNASNHNSIIGNTITNNGNGIWSERSPNPSSYNNIIGNNISENKKFGSLFRSSSNLRIEGNSIENNYYGIVLSGSSCQYNTIVENNIANNNEGISLGAGKYNNIVENNITNNDKGIYSSHSSNNNIYKNNFINNTIQIYDTIEEFPDSASPSENIWNYGVTGNYWSDYNGIDNDGDGIGDTPYVIDANNQDNYPLMKPIEISETEIPDILPEFPRWTPMLLIFAVFTVAVTIYKRRLRKLRNKKHMSCKHELLEKK